MPTNRTILHPRRLPSDSVEASFGSAAANSELTHTLIRSLINTFAPKQLEKKYWQLSMTMDMPTRYERKQGWFNSYTVHHIDNYQGIGELDDIEALESIVRMTRNHIAMNAEYIEECAKVLTVT